MSNDEAHAFWKATPANHPDLLKPLPLCGEDLHERISRFRLLIEHPRPSWDITAKDLNALRTADATLNFLTVANAKLKGRIHALEDLLEGVK